MVYSDTTDNQGLYQLAQNLSDTDSNFFGEKTFRAYANVALDDYVTLAIYSAGIWQFDDTEKTDFPIATTSIVSGQYDYELGDSNTEMLTIRRVEMDDGNDNWTVLTQVDEQDFKRRSLTEEHQVNALPNEYYLKGSSIFLIPTPNANVTNGLKVYYERNLTKFDGTVTQEAGIPSIHHPYIAIKASHLFAIQKDLKNETKLRDMVAMYENKIPKHYVRRNKARNPRMDTTFVKSE